MEIRTVETDKKRYLNLLLLADEQEDMIDRYLSVGPCMCWRTAASRPSAW